jgi:hypothetical protein
MSGIFLFSLIEQKAQLMQRFVDMVSDCKKGTVGFLLWFVLLQMIIHNREEFTQLLFDITQVVT